MNIDVSVIIQKGNITENIETKRIKIVGPQQGTNFRCKMHFGRFIILL